MKPSTARLALLLALVATTAACTDQPNQQRRGKRFYYAPDTGGGVWRGNAQTGDLQHCVYTAGQDVSCIDAPAPKGGKDKAVSAPAN